MPHNLNEPSKQLILIGDVVINNWWCGYSQLVMWLLTIGDVVTHSHVHVTTELHYTDLCQHMQH